MRKRTQPANYFEIINGNKPSGVHVQQNGRARELRQGHGISMKPVPGTVEITTPDGKPGWIKPGELMAGRSRGGKKR